MPPEPYGRTPGPCWPPTGTPTTTLPISVVRLPVPKSIGPAPVVTSKKFGDQPKSTSAPTMPWPIQVAVPPNTAFFSKLSEKSPTSPKFASPPKLTPSHGVRDQSARAGTAVHPSMPAASTRARRVATIGLRLISNLPVQRTQHDGAARLRALHDSVRSRVRDR